MHAAALGSRNGVFGFATGDVIRWKIAASGQGRLTTLSILPLSPCRVDPHVDSKWFVAPFVDALSSLNARPLFSSPGLHNVFLSIYFISFHVFLSTHSLLFSLCRPTAHLTAFLLPSSPHLQPPLATLMASHLTLFIFRTIRRQRETELRHQRSPDVVLTCPARATLGGPLEVPEDVALAIETMLPESPGRRLDLWASAGAGRARELERLGAREAETLRRSLPPEILERPVAGCACREGWIHLFEG